MITRDKIAAYADEHGSDVLRNILRLTNSSVMKVMSKEDLREQLMLAWDNGCVGWRQMPLLDLVESVMDEIVADLLEKNWESFKANWLDPARDSV